MASVRHRKRNVQSPSERIKVSAGFGPSACCSTPTARPMNGSSARANRAGLTAGCCRALRVMAKITPRSEQLLEVHAGVHRSHLGFVAVEHQGRSLLGKQVAVTEAPLGRLAPPWMVDVGIHVGVETVFLGGGERPAG